MSCFNFCTLKDVKIEILILTVNKWTYPLLRQHLDDSNSDTELEKITLNSYFGTREDMANRENPTKYMLHVFPSEQFYNDIKELESLKSTKKVRLFIIE